MYSNFAILCLVVPVSYGFKFETRDSCFTPNGKPGECVIINDCAPLFQYLQTRQNLNYLRESHCGFEGILPKVCCSTKSELTRDPRELLPDTNTCGTGGYSIGHGRIIGGTVTELTEYPWAVLLGYQKPNGRGFHCGGTLISNRYVLTAAHCVNKIPRGWNLVIVRVGEYDLQTDTDCVLNDCIDPALDIPVAEKIVHEAYDPSNRNQPNDIALLRLGREVQFTKSVVPICLPVPADFLNNRYDNVDMTVVGWGRTEKQTTSNVKLKLDVPVKPFRNCSSLYKSAGVQLTEGQFCAGGIKGKDSCTGDSGGPLMVYEGDSWYIAGIVSFGPTPCAVESWPGVYTKVAHYMEWILSKLKL